MVVAEVAEVAEMLLDLDQVVVIILEVVVLEAEAAVLEVVVDQLVVAVVVVDLVVLEKVSYCYYNSIHKIMML